MKFFKWALILTVAMAFVSCDPQERERKKTQRQQRKRNSDGKI